MAFPSLIPTFPPLYLGDRSDTKSLPTYEKNLEVYKEAIISQGLFLS